MAGGLPIYQRLAPARRAGALLIMLVLPALAYAAGPSTGSGGPSAASELSAASEPSIADLPAAEDAVSADDPVAETLPHSPSFGPPGPTPGVPSPEELEAAGAVI